MAQVNVLCQSQSVWRSAETSHESEKISDLQEDYPIILPAT